jgi:uncharacterized protein YjbI with pentapeptide repeats
MGIEEILNQRKLWLTSEGKEGRWVDLRGADLRGANLRGADLSYADLRDADLSYADLSGADLRGADLSGADLSEATLSDADLSEATLSDADLRGANLIGVVGKNIIKFNGGMHLLIYVDGFIRIGCQYHTLDHWLKHGRQIGEDAGYTDLQIEVYMNFIKDLK